MVLDPSITTYFGSCEELTYKLRTIVLSNWARSVHRPHRWAARKLRVRLCAVSSEIPGKDRYVMLWSTRRSHLHFVVASCFPATSQDERRRPKHGDIPRGDAGSVLPILLDSAISLSGPKSLAKSPSMIPSSSITFAPATSLLNFSRWEPTSTFGASYEAYHFYSWI